MSAQARIRKAAYGVVAVAGVLGIGAGIYLLNRGQGGPLSPEVSRFEGPESGGPALPASVSPGRPAQDSGGTGTGREAPEVLPREPLSAKDQLKLSVLDQVLASKNDNDPRIDSELKDFSPAAKGALSARYLAIPQERRNERGTVVFLLGREIREPSDLRFFSEVLAEKACLSLEDCTRVPGASGGDEAHFESMNEVTANYPQLQALRALKLRALELRDEGSGENPGAPSTLLSAILETLRNAGASPNARVAGEAREILEELTHDGQQ